MLVLAAAQEQIGTARRDDRKSKHGFDERGCQRIGFRSAIKKQPTRRQAAGILKHGW